MWIQAWENIFHMAKDGVEAMEVTASDSTSGQARTPMNVSVEQVRSLLDTLDRPTYID